MIGLKFNIAEIRDVIKGIEETPEKILSLYSFFINNS